MNPLRALLSSALVLATAAACSKGSTSNVDCGGGAVSSSINQFDNGQNGLNFGFGSSLNLQTGFQGNNAFLLANGGQSIEGLQLCSVQDLQSQFFDNCTDGHTFGGGQFWNIGSLNSLNQLNGLQFGMVGFQNGQQTGGLFQFGVSGNQVGIQALNANGQLGNQSLGNQSLGSQSIGGLNSQFTVGAQPTIQNNPTSAFTTTPALGGAQPTSVSYARDIVPIVQTSCLSCHNGAQAVGVPNLSTLAGLAAAAQSGALMRDLNAGTMPIGGAKLSAAQVSLFQAWVTAGEPQ